jgi:hypothetical protein
MLFRYSLLDLNEMRSVLEEGVDKVIATTELLQQDLERDSDSDGT